MGAYNSKLVEDYQTHSNESFEYNLYSWEHTKPKNWDYYNGKRFFKISRSLYPNEFERGLIYGYTYVPQYHYTTFLQEEEDDE